MIIREAEAIIRDLYKQDVASDDVRAPAEAIEAWYGSAIGAGDDDVHDAINTLGMERAAEVYSACIPCVWAILTDVSRNRATVAALIADETPTEEEMASANVTSTSYGAYWRVARVPADTRVSARIWI